jgi:tetratricopeptide (TPR) repeat protein
VNKPVTNQSLEDLLAEAAYDRSHAAFARQVNTAGARDHGLILRYDGASVYWWLRGRRPEQPGPELIATVLSARLHRQVNVAELGFAGRDGERDGLLFPATVPEAVETASALWRRFGRRGRPTTVAPFVTSAAIEAGWRWHFDPPDSSIARAAGRRVTGMDVEMLRGCFDQFLELDRRHGGGHARTFLADFLTRDVAPLLRGSYTDPVGRDLFAVAAELTGMAGFMSYDISEHGAAQRAFIQALRLSKASGDRSYGAHILANLATQAVFLDLPGEAVRLSRAATDGAGRCPVASVSARLLSCQATAHAVAGDLQAFRSAIGKAVHALNRADGTGPSWARYFSPAHLAGSAMRSLLDLGRPEEALTFREQVMDLAPGNARTRALHTALTATAYAQAGHVDAAAHLALEALALAQRVRSERVQARITLLASTLTPHRPVPEVAAFLEQAAGP